MIERALDHWPRNNERLERVRGERDHGVGHSGPTCDDEAAIGRSLLVARAAHESDVNLRRRVAYLLIDGEAARLGRLARVHLIPDGDGGMVTPGGTECEHTDDARDGRVRLSPERDVRT